MPEPPPEPRAVVPADGPIVMRSSESVAIDRKHLTGDAPVLFELELPEGVGVKSGRLVKPGPIELRLDDELGGQRETVSLALPVDQLQQSGRYLLELRTTERSALPLRRFGIVVR
jgi:hypothetical protein